jgi:hypothetical protein
VNTVDGFYDPAELELAIECLIEEALRLTEQAAEETT